ncbi:MAG: hypothetical protein HRT89_06505 [Lentisphaeria bacterium]|nr:hypothetical protein [Lentisphaeria bacterium]NQZ67704.1 hypothetical protein [Lentisphaeria bacterium]
MIMLIAAIVLNYRIAEMAEMNGALWGFITFMICLAFIMFIPIPDFLCVGLGCLVTYILLGVVKIKTG